MSKKTIKLTEQDLHNIIKKTVAILKDKTSEVNFNINSIDISKINIEILKQAYFDFRLVPSITAYGDVLSNNLYIKESFGDIQPPDSIVNRIIQKYNLPPQLVIKREAYNKIYIYVITAIIGENDKIIEDDMKKMGYFLGHKGNIQKIQGMTFQVLQFEPYSQTQNDETENIKSKYNCLYHWTPCYNVNNILKDGLIPNHQNNLFNYPPRIYLMNEDCNLLMMIKLGMLLCQNNKNQNNNGEYALLKINISNIKENDIQSYFDSNSEFGIYTEQKIPPKYIELLNVYNLKDI
jgi:hypothetical protein